MTTFILKKKATQIKPSCRQCACARARARLARVPAKRWNTSAAPFSHALCLFKVTSEKGICIGKRNSECKCGGDLELQREPAAREGNRDVSWATCTLEKLKESMETRNKLSVSPAYLLLLPGER